MSSHMEPHCDICGRAEDVTAGLLKTETDQLGHLYICSQCATDFYEFFQDTPTSADVTSIHPHRHQRNTPRQIVEFLDQYVIGQDRAKKDIAIAIYNHYKRLHSVGTSGVELSKSNILMIGPTGCGKTAIVQSVARSLDVPFVIGDATCMTQSGYVGEDVSSVIQNLLIAANGDVAKAERGIVFIDEIDKVAKRADGGSASHNPGHEAVQQELLKIIEGSKVQVPKGNATKRTSSQTETVDTTNILFIFAGAFVGLDKIVQSRCAKESVGIGFTTSVKQEEQERHPVIPEDLHRFGLIPEFVGRVPIICELNELDQSTLEHILTQPKNSITKQFTELLKMDGVDLTFTEEAVAKIASNALEMKTGARGLRAMVETLLKDTMFEAPDGMIKSVTVEVEDGELHISREMKDELKLA